LIGRVEINTLEAERPAHLQQTVVHATNIAQRKAYIDAMAEAARKAEREAHSKFALKQETWRNQEAERRAKMRALRHASEEARVRSWKLSAHIPLNEPASPRRPKTARAAN